MIKSIVDRLLEAGTPFRIVGGAGALSSVKDRPPAVPAAYVYLAVENSAPNERATGPVVQRMSGDISVVIVTENLSGSDDWAAADEIENLKAFVRERLIGFVVTGGDCDPLEHVSGELQQAVAGMIWFEDTFATARYLEEQP
ncbi:MAG: hypothetical protein K0M49_16760 [Arenimonas sp.]|nr:hypothetical protein [Rhizobium sp.]MBW8447274.1 hypothetical protein [Arenimonas sp.]